MVFLVRGFGRRDSPDVVVDLIPAHNPKINLAIWASTAAQRSNKRGNYFNAASETSLSRQQKTR
jgi:hypothetical protein